jgi:hypothetical protein
MRASGFSRLGTIGSRVRPVTIDPDEPWLPGSSQEQTKMDVGWLIQACPSPV